MRHLHRVKSLSLNVPIIQGTPSHRLLLCPAPLLECCRLHCLENDSDCIASLPSDLFQNHAPLRTLSLRNLFPPSDPCPAVRFVTHLVHEAYCFEQEDLQKIFAFFPALRSLTIVGHEGSELASIEDIRCALPLHLRVSAIPNIEPLIECFPKASSVCMSASTKYVKNDRRAANHLLAAAQRRPPASLDIIWRPCQCDLGASYDRHPQIRQLGGLAISLDDVDVVVDLLAEDAIHAVTAAWPELTRELLRLAIPEDFCPFISLMALPALDELTLYVRHPADRLKRRMPAPQLKRDGPVHRHRHAVSSLRIVAPPGDARGIPDLDEHFARIIGIVVDLHALRTLVLCGVGLDSRAGDPEGDAGWLRSLAPQLEVVHEPRQAAPHWESWVWKFPEEAAN